MTEQIRAFIAIELPAELRLALNQLQAQLKSSRQSSVKWVDADSIHLTLKFLGNIASDSIAEITRAMEEAARVIIPFHLEVKGVGAFPNLKRVQVVWVGIGGEVDKLNQLQQRLESNLAPLGFTPESRAFKAHLTLGRIRDHASVNERQQLGQLIADTEFEAGTIRVDAINLMRSQLTEKAPFIAELVPPG